MLLESEISGNAPVFPQLGDEESGRFSKIHPVTTLAHPLDFWHIGGDVMSQMRAQELSLPAVAETRLGVARLADRVCEATRQAALEGAGSALSILAADQSPVLPDAIKSVADRALARIAIMQTEFDRFRAVTRRGASMRSGRWQQEPAVTTAALVDLAPHRTRCHGDAPQPVRAK
ncbi:MAG: hypothetical protein C0484_26020 [Rhodospirillum sp.]|jgi:hypothetical protein|nr:hypothetical protein [Rhodospirillum sp.]